MSLLEQFFWSFLIGCLIGHYIQNRISKDKDNGQDQP